MLKIAVLLAGSRGLLSVLRFARNVLVARLIGVEDYGIASTFALLMALVEMLSDLGLGRFLVQDREGGHPQVVAAIQGLVLLRGAIISILDRSHRHIERLKRCVTDQMPLRTGLCSTRFSILHQARPGFRFIMAAAWA